MSLQLIFVVETDKKCKSDWIYIKDTVDRFYQYDQAQVKLSPVYMGGKGKYRNKEKEISNLIAQYASASSSKTSQSKVLYCFDCDDYDIKQEDSEFLKNAQQYCIDRGYDFIWFCKDVERVYLGKKVDNSQKKKEATIFKSKKLINNVNAGKLFSVNYKDNTSNIMTVLNKYLTQK